LPLVIRNLRGGGGIFYNFLNVSESLKLENSGAFYQQ
tara:strand:+ start:289 stop:399 length:111 start_codon:yes stop_codon:yes gene_type:complete